MSSHIGLLVKRTARAVLFGPPKPRPTLSQIKAAKTQQLRDELARDRLREVQIELGCLRAVEEALR